jgi:hypothetical protein
MDVENTTLAKREPFFVRTAVEQIRAAVSAGNSRGVKRDIKNEVMAGSGTERKQGFYRNALSLINTDDTVRFPLFVSRLMREWLNATDGAGHWGDYLRGLYTEAGSVAETRHKGEYYREVQDTAGAWGCPCGICLSSSGWQRFPLSGITFSPGSCGQGKNW